MRQQVLDRGRRAGLNIGSAIDKIVRHRSNAAEQQKTVASSLEAGEVELDSAADVAPPEAIVAARQDPITTRDVSTIAVRRAVRQPAIFAPGHLLTALLAGGIIHIVTTFGITQLGTGSAFHRLKPVLPANELVLLPAQSAARQMLPFIMPDMLYAICRFNLSAGGVEMSANLPEPGWSLALYTRSGDNFYATPGQSQRAVSVTFLLQVASDRLTNLTPGARKSDVDVNQVTSPETEGLMVVRAPLKGVAFEAAARAELQQARCSPTRR